MDTVDKSSLFVVGHGVWGTTTFSRSSSVLHSMPRIFASGVGSPDMRELCSAMFASAKISSILVIPFSASSFEWKEVQISSIIETGADLATKIRFRGLIAVQMDVNGL